MARKVIHQLVDDLDESVLEPGEGETVLFAIDGKSYEIDLKTQNAEALREAFAPYIKAGRRAGAANAPAARSARKRNSGVDLSAVRDWARKNGHTVSERGRVPQSILDAYNAAN
ncbi:histone-like nucleoid-structuring protein Lsr2 [Microbacterium marinilacus]|nr:Lsr2 family protein [Microbacterium marinilacus]MBY0690375.1 Lsr2 family protein [Microbacterium marinilacus]